MDTPGGLQLSDLDFSHEILTSPIRPKFSLFDLCIQVSISEIPSYHLFIYFYIPKSYFLLLNPSFKCQVDTLKFFLHRLKVNLMVKSFRQTSNVEQQHRPGCHKTPVPFISVFSRRFNIGHVLLANIQRLRPKRMSTTITKFSRPLST